MKPASVLYQAQSVAWTMSGDGTMKRVILIVAILALIVTAVGLPTATRADDSAPKKSPTTGPSAPTTNPDQSGVTKFYGSISAVDTKAMTFTVDNQTYSIVGETQMTKAADNSPAALADAVVGEPARGSFVKSSDGKLNVTKVRFGKKAGGGKGGGKKSKDATTQSQDR